jgi:hypothetical protein
MKKKMCIKKIIYYDGDTSSSSPKDNDDDSTSKKKTVNQNYSFVFSYSIQLQCSFTIYNSWQALTLMGRLFFLES